MRMFAAISKEIHDYLVDIILIIFRYAIIGSGINNDISDDCYRLDNIPKEFMVGQWRYMHSLT